MPDGAKRHIHKQTTIALIVRLRLSVCDYERISRNMFRRDDLEAHSLDWHMASDDGLP